MWLCQLYLNTIVIPLFMDYCHSLHYSVIIVGKQRGRTMNYGMQAWNLASRSPHIENEWRDDVAAYLMTFFV